MARGEDWSREEVEATVAEYFAMLALELRGEPYSKTEHRRRLRRLLRERSDSAVERKHGNISAVLIELGCPYISGYKAYRNYQALVAEVVHDRLEKDTGLRRLAEASALAGATPPGVKDILAALEDAPRPGRARAGRDSHRYDRPRLRPMVNYLELEARNRSLGLAGEEFVLQFEHARLVKLGEGRLADRVEHVARTRGDGLGYDVLSYEAGGRERLIEVKTTRYGRETPFFVTRNELEVSKGSSERYHLYRLFEFREAPRLFALAGALSAVCDLDPATYVARVA